MTLPARCRTLLLLAAFGCAGEPLRAEPGEQLSGGDTTLLLLVSASQAYSFPAANLEGDRRSSFFTGNAFFNQAWTVAPSSTTARDGLGPTFNARACSSCHFRDGRGAPPDEGGELESVLLRLSIEQGGELVPHPEYGDQLQPMGVEGVPGEGRPIVEWEDVLGEYSDGISYTLRRPVYRIDELAFGELGEIRISPRAAPQMIGLGLLEAIPAATLRELADPDDSDGDGISGRVHELDGGQIGRFGWKGETPTVLAQSAGAFVGDMGITSSLHPEENCPAPQVECAEAPSGGEVEIEDELLEKVAFYGRTLAVPARRNVDDPQVLRGRELMRDMGCTSCHLSRIETGELDGFPELSNQTIRPFTDMLLHDLGEELSDRRPVSGAEGAEWRTPALWGLSYMRSVNGHLSLLHDGRARGFEEAILWHGGEAEQAREAFRNSTEAERADLLSFLESL